MIQDARILMVDPHPMTLTGYISTLRHYLGMEERQIDMANTLDMALGMVQQAPKFPYDVVLLDAGMPASQDERFISGEDWGIALRKEHPHLKILMLAVRLDNFRVNSILDTIKPNGLITKCKLTKSMLAEAMTTIIQGGVYYCETIAALIHQRTTLKWILEVTSVRSCISCPKGKGPKICPVPFPSPCLPLSAERRC